VSSLESVPFGVVSAAASSSSRLTLSREIVDSRWVVRRGELGCFAPWSLCSLGAGPPFVSGSVAAGSVILGTEGASDVDVDVLSGAGPGLLTEDDRRFVRDLVPSVDLSRASWTGAAMAVSVASSKVSYSSRRRSSVESSCVLHVRRAARLCRVTGRARRTMEGGLSVHSRPRNCQQRNLCSHAASAHLPHRGDRGPTWCWRVY
jgi:hypothetical protein